MKISSGGLSATLFICIVICLGAAAAQAQNRLSPKPWVEQERFEKMCAAPAKGADDSMVQQLGSYLLLGDDQKAALKDVHEAYQKALSDERALCSSKPDFQTVPGRIAFDEARIEARLNGARSVRDKVDAFYGKLNGEQKAKFDQGYYQNQDSWRHPYD